MLSDILTFKADNMGKTKANTAEYKKMCSCGKMFNFINKNIHHICTSNALKAFDEETNTFVMHLFCPFCGDKVYLISYNKTDFTDPYITEKIKTNLQLSYITYMNYIRECSFIFISHKVTRHGQKGLHFYKTFKNKCKHTLNISYHKSKINYSISFFPYKWEIEFNKVFYCIVCGMRVVFKNGEKYSNVIKKEKEFHSLPNSVKNIYIELKNSISDKYMKQFFDNDNPENSLTTLFNILMKNNPLYEN